MAATVRTGDLVKTTEPCHAPGTIPLAPRPEGTVLINGKAAARFGDLTMPYAEGFPPVCVTNAGKPITGPCSPTVLVEGKPLSLFGDVVDGKNPVIEYSPNVFADTAEDTFEVAEE